MRETRTPQGPERHGLGCPKRTPGRTEPCLWVWELRGHWAWWGARGSSPTAGSQLHPRINRTPGLIWNLGVTPYDRGVVNQSPSSPCLCHELVLPSWGWAAWPGAEGGDQPGQRARWLPEQISEHTEKMVTRPLSPSTACTGHMTQTNLEPSREGSSGKFTSSSAKVTPCQSTVVPLPLASPGNPSLTNSVLLRCNSHTMKSILLVTSPWLSASSQGPATTSTIYIRLGLCHPPQKETLSLPAVTPQPTPSPCSQDSTFCFWIFHTNEVVQNPMHLF